MTEARTVMADPALGFSYQVVLDKDARRTLVFQGHVTIETPVEKINELLDKIGTAADRQIALYELQEAREAVSRLNRGVKGIVTQRAMLEATAQEEYEQSGRKGEWSPSRLTPQQRQQRLALEQAITKYKEDLERWELDLARCEKLVNGHGLDLGADRHPGVSGG